MQMKATIVIVLVAFFAVQRSEAFWRSIVHGVGAGLQHFAGDDLRAIREMSQEDFVSPVLSKNQNINMQMKATIVIVLVAFFAVQRSEAFWRSIVHGVGAGLQHFAGDDLRAIREMSQEDFDELVKIVDLIEQ